MTQSHNGSFFSQDHLFNSKISSPFFFVMPWDQQLAGFLPRTLNSAVRPTTSHRLPIDGTQSAAAKNHRSKREQAAASATNPWGTSSGCLHSSLSLSLSLSHSHPFRRKQPSRQPEIGRRSAGGRQAVWRTKRQAGRNQRRQLWERRGGVGGGEGERRPGGTAGSRRRG